MGWEKVEQNIYRDSEDKHKFQVRLYCGRDARGKLKTTKKVIKGNLTDARNLLKEHEANMLHHTAKAPMKVTLGQVIEDWNNNYGRTHTTLTTQSSNQNLQKHIIAYMGNVRIDRINVSLVEQYLNYVIEEKGLSNKTANKHREHLNIIFNYIVSHPDDYGVFSNPVDHIKPFRVTKKTMEIYSMEENLNLIRLLDQSGRDDLEIAVLLALFTGTRREEVCGLRWPSINLDTSEIIIRDTRTTAKGTVVDAGQTKNKEERVVGIPAYLHRKLSSLKEKQDGYRKFYGKDYYNDEYVFCKSDGKPWHPNSLSREFNSFLVKNGLRVIRFHDLRHTNISLLLSKMPVMDVAEIGGHKQASTTTDIYGHVIGSAREKQISVIDEAFESLTESK